MIYEFIVAKWLSFITTQILLVPSFSNSELIKFYSKESGRLNHKWNRHLIDNLNGEVKHGINHKMELNDIDDLPVFA
jgi:hypothetical protein